MKCTIILLAAAGAVGLPAAAAGFQAAQNYPQTQNPPPTPTPPPQNPTPDASKAGQQDPNCDTANQSADKSANGQDTEHQSAKVGKDTGDIPTSRKKTRTASNDDTACPTEPQTEPQ